MQIQSLLFLFSVQQCQGVCVKQPSLQRVMRWRRGSLLLLLLLLLRLREGKGSGRRAGRQAGSHLRPSECAPRGSLRRGTDTRLRYKPRGTCGRYWSRTADRTQAASAQDDAANLLPAKGEIQTSLWHFFCVTGEWMHETGPPLK